MLANYILTLAQSGAILWLSYVLLRNDRRHKKLQRQHSDLELDHRFLQSQMITLRDRALAAEELVCRSKMYEAATTEGVPFARQALSELAHEVTKAK